MAAPVNQANQGPVAIVEWNPEPTKQAVKQTYDVGLTVLAAAVKAPVKFVTATYYGPANDTIVDFAVDKTKEVAKQGTDAIADAYYETPNSLGSRTAKWYGYQG